MPEKLKKRSKDKILELQPFLDEWVKKVEKPTYINSDPVLFMHAFNDKADQLLAGFFAAIMAWGRRDIVIRKVQDLLDRMNNRPAEFIGNFSSRDVPRFDGFKHRTFKPIDIKWLVKILQKIMLEFHSFENFWGHCYRNSQEKNKPLMTEFHEEFFAQFPESPQRTRKHISNADKKSSCKRLYLFLRWSIRNNSPVDLGLMDFINPSHLMIPLDVHVARQARKLGLMSRRYNDWKAVNELTEAARLLDPSDPAKYDYALFGLGVNTDGIPEEFIVNQNVD